MAIYQGNIENVNHSSQYVFDFLADFRHFEKFLPEQVTDWEATDEYCKFGVPGMGTVKLIFLEKKPHSLIVIQPAPDSGFPVPFFLKAFLTQNENEENNSTFQFVADADIHGMVALMVDGPLRQFVAIITTRLKEYLDSVK